ncbi:Unconventional myosin-Va like [Actinidia chinensis var. chinensis]|uniref:Unconventional myosin-Va like n=1 Tax=Actinidia chinensis var. chinensis TaxID=1590841 RepID=A0A2R6RU40_ACTCC|nr:Unconventional myosin-Va like [Actinidia chinensis var. chinensis]
MSSGEVRQVSREDIQLVQNLIERCLQLYMSQKEVVNTLLVQAKIEPGFTELVWQKLEEENREFFNAYYLRLIVKDQIREFNRLLEKQDELMRQICPAGVASLPMSNGSHIPALHQNSACYAPERTGPNLKTENVNQLIGSSLPHSYHDGGSSLHPCMQNVDMSALARRIDVSPTPSLAQCSHVGMMQGMNGGMIKSETGYAGSSQYMFGNDGNVLEVRPAIGDASVSSFSSVESNSQPVNESLLDADNSSLGYLGQIPRNFSLSDLTVDFSNSSDILGSYSGSPFLGADTNFLDHHGRGEHQGPNAPPC